METQNIIAPDGTAIRVARFAPEGEVAGVIMVAHGHGEGLEHYAGLAEFFNASGWALVAHDQRGFGLMPELDAKSKRKRQGVAKYADLVADIHTIRNHVDEWFPNVSVALLGYSMGGNVVSNVLINDTDKRFDMGILIAPFFRPLRKIPAVGKIIAKCIGTLSREICVDTKLDLTYVTRDNSRFPNLGNDGIAHARMSMKLYSELDAAATNALDNANKMRVPVIVLLAGDDRMVCNESIRRFAHQGGDNVKLVEYPDAYHCLHYEINMDTVRADMLGFISSHSSGRQE